MRRALWLLIWLLPATFAAACGNQEIAGVVETATESPAPASTPAPTETPSPTQTPAPSATPSATATATATQTATPRPTATPNEAPETAVRTFYAPLNGLQFDVPAWWETRRVSEPDFYVTYPPDDTETFVFIIAPGGEVSQFLEALEVGVPEDLTPATAEETLGTFLSSTGGLVVEVESLTGEIESVQENGRDVATVPYEGRSLQNSAAISGTVAVVKENGAVAVIVTVSDGTPAAERALGALVDTMTLDDPGADYRSPVWSADGQQLFFTSRQGPDGQVDIFAVDAEGGDLVQVTDDPESEARVAVSPDGGRLAFTMYTDAGAMLTVLDLESGEKEELLPLPQGLGGPSWSPDGSRLAFASAQEGDDIEIFILDLADGSLTQITDSSLVATAPHWSPDGERILYYAFSEPAADLYVINADGTNQVRLTTDGDSKGWPQWSPDGTQILFGQNVAEENWAIFVMDADGTNRTQLTDPPGMDNAPSWSPDGGQVAFDSDRGQEGSQAFNIFVIDVESGEIRQLTP